MLNDLSKVYTSVINLLSNHDAQEKIEAFGTAVNKLEEIGVELHSAILEDK